MTYKFLVFFLSISSLLSFYKSFHNDVKDVSWNGKKAAIVLTYDDALDVHLDYVIPSLDSYNFKGTFYLSVSFSGCQNRISDWRKAANNGHELGNHSMYHPCDASKEGRSWVAPINDLNKYTTAEIVREINMTNTFLESLDGKKERTFAFPCGDTLTHEGSFVEGIKNQFVALRGVESKMNVQGNIDMTNIYSYYVDENNLHQLKTWAEKAKAENALMVLLFHGVGGGHSINVDLQKHNDFIRYLHENEKDFWVTTMVDAAKFVKTIDK